MIIEKIKINRSKEIWVTKNPINGKIVIQIRLCERRNGNLKSTNKCILLNLKSIDKVIKSLEFIKLLESDIYGKS